MQERRRREPRHERGILDRVPRVVAAPADLDVRPVRAEQLTEAEERPRDEGPAAGRHDPALVGLAREHRSCGERERNRQPDVPEVEHRRVRDHVRVLEARRQPRAVDRRRLRAEGARDSDENECEERRDASEHRHDPCRQVTHELAVQCDGECAVAGQDEQPEEQRALLPAPEGAQCVRHRERAVRVLGDIVKEKSWRTSADASTIAAISVDAKQQYSALRADAARRRRFVTAAVDTGNERVHRTARG